MRLFLIFIISLTIASCSHENTNTIVPNRVKGIPDKAFWVGGTDGGNWYLVEYVHPHRNNAVIKVYNDQDGSLIISKRFMVICPEDNPTYIDSLQKQISSFDGEKIYLESPNGKAGCYLQ